MRTSPLSRDRTQYHSVHRWPQLLFNLANSYFTRAHILPPRWSTDKSSPPGGQSGRIGCTRNRSSRWGGRDGMGSGITETQTIFVQSSEGSLQSCCYTHGRFLADIRHSGNLGALSLQHMIRLKVEA